RWRPAPPTPGSRPAWPVRAAEPVFPNRIANAWRLRLFRRFLQFMYGLAHTGAQTKDQQIVHRQDTAFTGGGRRSDAGAGPELFHAAACIQGSPGDDDQLGTQ